MGQPAHLEENFVTNLKSSIEMAPGGSRPCRSPCRNPPPLDLVEDEPARELGPGGGPHSGSISPALSHNPIPGLELVLALNPTPVPALPPPSSDELFKNFMKAYLESNQGPVEERKRTLKAKVSEVYYGKLHMDCYHFCQQCKDYLRLLGLLGSIRLLLQLPFFMGTFVFWAKFKRRNRGEELTLITWIDFKAFL